MLGMRMQTMVTRQRHDAQVVIGDDWCLSKDCI